MSTRYNTGNPIESTDVRDMSDNAKNFDEFSNSSADTFTDRLGVNRKTIDGVIRSVGIPIIGNFTTGCTVTDSNQGVQEVGGSVYRWKGSLPKFVPPSSTPSGTGGISPAGDWVDIGDASLRGDLSSESGGSYLGIGGGRTQADKNAEWVSVTDAPYLVKYDNGATDNTVALNAAFQSGKSVFVPDPGDGNFAQVSDTIKIGDGTTVFFQNPGRAAIKASSSMDPNKHLICTKNYAEGILTPNENIHLFGLNVDANGFSRGGGPLTSGMGFVFNAIDSTVDLPTVSNSPKWNYFFTSGNPFVDVGHSVESAACSERLSVTRVTSIDPIGGDGGIIQGTKDSSFLGYKNIITPSLAPSKVRKDAGLQVVGGCHNLVIDDLEFFHNGALSSGFVVSVHDNEGYTSNLKIGSIYGRELSTLVGVFNDVSVQPIGGNDWLTNGLIIESAHLDYPVLDAASTVMQSRLIDIQNMGDISVGKCSARIKKPDGTYSAPTCVVNFDGAINAYVDMVVIDGVPDVGAASYPTGKGRGWVNLSNTTNKNVSVGAVEVENFGYLNRIISDTSGGEFKSAKSVSAGGAFSDGGTKELIVSSSQDLTVFRCVTPSGATLGRFGSNFTAATGGNVNVRQSSRDLVLGGQTIKSINISGVQSQPGTVYERQFVSPSDPTGLQGKGSISFVTSAATEGRLSISAYHEDVSEFRPILEVRSTNAIKEIRPVLDNAVTIGSATNRPTQIFAVSGTINTSDANEKTKPQAITDAMLDAADDINIDVWKWLESIAKKGEESARWHFGPIAQQVRDAFAKHGLDGCDYGLLCYDKWGDEFVDVTEDVIGEDGEVVSTPTGEKRQIQWEGDRWGIRQDQCLWLKMAAVERRCARVEDRLSKAGL